MPRRRPQAGITLLEVILVMVFVGLATLAIIRIIQAGR
jgi:Tfp pilus assembly protein PilV